MISPIIENAEFLMKSKYFLALVSAKYIGTIPLPSNGGSGIKLNMKSIRFNENITLIILARLSKIPVL